MAARPAVTILLADDHAVVRDGLISLLREHHFDVVGAVGDGQALLDAAKKLRPDVIITDVTMPKLSGVEALARLMSAQPESRVIVLTMHDDAELATRAMKAGASGFLLKEAAGDELVNAINQVMQGRVYLSPAVTRDVMTRMAAPAGPVEPQLTPRQLEVLRLMLQGQRMKEIASTLALSPRTVEFHKYEMMQVLGVKSTAELILYAVDHRLVSE
jgi:DNA-binding NarL/FixJ family response regulator